MAASQIFSFIQDNNDTGLRDPDQADITEITSFTVHFDAGTYGNIKQTHISADTGYTKTLFQTIPDWLELKAKSQLDAHKIKLAFNTSLATYTTPTEENGYKQYEYISSTMPPQVVNGKAVLKKKPLESFLSSAAHDRSYCYITKSCTLRHKVFTKEEVTKYLSDPSNKNSLAQYFLDKNAWQTMTIGYVLVENGKIALDRSKLKPDVSARTAIGQKADGTFVVLAVNGKSGAFGITHYMEAARMLKLGCVNAYALDGGGSTTLWYNGTVVTLGTEPKNGIRSKKYESYEYGTMYLRRRPNCMYLL